MRLRHVTLLAAIPAALSLGAWTGRAATGAEAAATRASSAEAPDGAPLFDHARHMRVSEVRVGMKGYGLSIFRGTKIERFDVEVLSILKNFNPKCDVVLITCKGANLEHTGAIAGMSGSPIFLRDDAGHDRMIGAFAYGWPLAKDPIAGVQPIEYMLKLPTGRPDRPGHDDAMAPPGSSGATRPGTGKAAGEPAGADAAWNGRWSIGDAAGQWSKLMHPAVHPVETGAGGIGRFTGEGGLPELQPLATPLMTAGLSPRLLAQFGPAFKSAGLMAIEAGGAFSGGETPRTAPVALSIEPGAVLAVPLLTGDVDMTALGTCTEVLGGRVFGFGHAFNNEGPVTLPVGTGMVNGVVATLSTSFKLGAMTATVGRLTVDQTVGVAGWLGESAPTVPVELTIVHFDQAGGSREQTYHFQSASHPKFTPLLTGAAFAAAVGGVSELPQYNTVDYEVNLEFGNGRTIRVADRAVNTNAGDLFQTVGLSLTAAAENPFQRVPLKRMTGTVKVRPVALEGQIEEVNVPRAKYKPGETIKGFVTYEPFRAPEATVPVELELPRDLRAGTYQLVVSDADRYLQDEQATKPFRFTAEKIGEIFDVLHDVTAIRHDALYVRLIRQPDGVAVGRTALPQLPSSWRQIMLGAGRSNTTQFVSSTVKVIPTNRVIAGSAEFVITIESSGRSEPGASRAATSRPSAPGKGDEPKPRGKPLQAPDAPPQEKHAPATQSAE